MNSNFVPPPELESYRRKYEKARMSKGQKGIYAFSYEKLYPLYSDQDLSEEAIAKKIGLTNRSAVSKVRAVRLQFFPMYSPRKGKLPSEEHMRRRAEQSAKYMRNPHFKLLGEYLRRVQLDGRLIPKSASPVLCNIGQVRCAVRLKTSGGKAAKFDLIEHEVDVHILLTDIHTDTATHGEIYCVPTGVILTSTRSVSVRLRPKRKGGPYPEIDTELYRGDRGLEKLRAMVERLDKAGARG